MYQGDSRGRLDRFSDRLFMDVSVSTTTVARSGPRVVAARLATGAIGPGWRGLIAGIYCPTNVPTPWLPSGNAVCSGRQGARKPMMPIANNSKASLVPLGLQAGEDLEV